MEIGREERRGRVKGERESKEREKGEERGRKRRNVEGGRKEDK